MKPKRNYIYNVGDKVTTINGITLECITTSGGGRTSASPVSIDINSSTVVDGDITWRVVLGEEYSTDEKRIGTWIDGKPLYQKTIVDTMPTVSRDGTRVYKLIDISTLTASKVISMEGFMYRGSADLNCISINSYNNLNQFSYFEVHREDSTKDYIDSIFVASSRIADSEITVYFNLIYTKV